MLLRCLYVRWSFVAWSDFLRTLLSSSSDQVAFDDLDWAETTVGVQRGEVLSIQGCSFVIPSVAGVVVRMVAYEGRVVWGVVCWFVSVSIVVRSSICCMVLLVWSKMCLMISFVAVFEGSVFVGWGIDCIHVMLDRRIVGSMGTSERV